MVQLLPTLPHAASRAVTLTCHPDTPSAAVEKIEVRVSRAGGALALQYRFEGDLEQLWLPPDDPARSPTPLWQHTCCEIFIRRAGDAAYHEFNFAPSRAWAAYAFARYRESVPLATEALEPEIAVSRSGSTLQLHARVPLSRLSPAHGSARLEIGLAAVTEDRAGALSYWALVHPPGKADFHRAEAFALELAPK